VVGGVIQSLSLRIQYTLRYRVDRLAFQRRDTEHSLVDAAQRFSTHEPLQCFRSKREFLQCQPSLTAETSLA
jgi:hypothetical protein